MDFELIDSAFKAYNEIPKDKQEKAKETINSRIIILSFFSIFFIITFKFSF